MVKHYHFTDNLDDHLVVQMVHGTLSTKKPRNVHKQLTGRDLADQMADQTIDPLFDLIAEQMVDLADDQKVDWMADLTRNKTIS